MNINIYIHSASMDESMKHLLATLTRMENRIMSKISEFATAQTAFQDKMDAAVSGLTTDIADLNAEILKLQTTPGVITPEDQALLDGIQTRSEAIAMKLEALDGLTPPVVPVVV